MSALNIDSLVIANTVELLGGKVPSANPLCPGAIFMLQPGADPGAPQPTTDFVASLLLDGERPFGRRASNRTIKLPVWITAPNRQILAAAREVLQQAIDQDYYTITWTRDPTNGNPGSTPLPLIFDCFRANPTVAVFNTLREKEICGMQVQITIPALPYGRSDTQSQVSFSSPVPANPPVPPPPSSVVLDNFSQISSVQCFQSNQCVVGPFTACWDPDRFGDPGGQVTAFNYGSTFSAPLNLLNMASLQFWFGLGSRYYANLEFHGKTHGGSVYITLTDTSGNQLSFSRSHLFLPVSEIAQAPVFTRISIPIPTDSTTFNYSSVASYSLEIINRSDRIRRLSWVTAYLDALTAFPGSQPVTPVVRGTVYTIYRVDGTARAAASLSFQQSPSPGSVTTVTATGAGTYTVPAGTAYLKVEATGGGGAGAGMTVAGVGAGGNGAEYAAETVFPTSAGTVIPYFVGAGDTAGATPLGGAATVFGPAPGGTLQVVANGGASVATNSNVVSAAGPFSANSVEHPGGLGRANPANTFGGGGGSAGGNTAAGNTPQGSGSVTFTSSTTWTCPPGVFSVFAEVWGPGGGSGSGGGNFSGGGGGGGEYRAGTIPVTPGNVYTITVPGGGAAGTLGGNGSAGSSCTFTGDSGNFVSAHSGNGGKGNSGGANASGGSGGTGSTGHNGGTGGSGYPYAGGGGSGAGPNAAGNAGSSPNGAIAPSGGGNGGNASGAQNANGVSGAQPGGGGGGTWNGSFTSGAGGAGQIRLTFPSGTGAPTASGGAAVSGGGAGGAGGGSSGTNGSNGSAPGGAGGGAFSSGTAKTGGNGANGQLIITPYIPAAFKSLIVHRPPLGALKTFQPLVSVGAGADVPDGSHQYTMPQPVTGVNADFGGTYTIYLVNSSFSGSSSRTVTVTVTQFEYAGGPGYSVATLPVSFTPSQVTNGILTAGVLTLPIKSVAPDNLGGYYTVSVTDTNTSDRWLDMIFLDTMGQTVVINEPSSGYVTYYIDAPDPNVTIGRIMGSQSGRANAISVMDNAPAISGGPLFVEPADGDNQLFVYSADGTAPNVALKYFATYYFDRTQ